MSMEDLKKAVGDKKLILGTERTLSELKKGNLKTIFLSQNCEENVKETIEINARMFKTEVSELKVSNDEMGVIVKKPFAVSVASLLK